MIYRFGDSTCSDHAQTGRGTRRWLSQVTGRGDPALAFAASAVTSAEILARALSRPAGVVVDNSSAARRSASRRIRRAENVSNAGIGLVIVGHRDPPGRLPHHVGAAGGRRSGDQAASAGGSTWSPTMASVVIIRPPTEAAFCSAQRTTLVGSMIPALTRSLNVAGLGVEAVVVLVLFQRLAGNDRAVFAAVGGDLAQRGQGGLADDLDPDALVVVVRPSASAGSARRAPGRRRRRERCLPRPPLGWRAGRHRRGPYAPSLRSRRRRRRG